MKGIILAGGTGSRLSPLTKVTNKHLLPVGKYPMIIHDIKRLTEAGMSDIMLVSGKEHVGDMIELLGSGKEYCCNITYKVQDESGGIAQALGLCEEFVGKDTCCVLLGDNIFEKPISSLLDVYFNLFYVENVNNMIVVKKVNDPQRFGVAEFKDGMVIGLEEKPKEPKSDMAVIGLYFYGPEVFDYIEKLEPSGRGELEITDVHKMMLKDGVLGYNTWSHGWTDAGTFDSLQEANKMAMSEGYII